MKNNIKVIIAMIAIGCSMASCNTVKEYEKVNLNDPDMALGDKAVNRNVDSFHSYREAASGANGGKTGGGCGCN